LRIKKLQGFPAPHSSDPQFAERFFLAKTDRLKNDQSISKINQYLLGGLDELAGLCFW
jgi:hypothetical protein